MKILVGTTNPGKIEGARRAFSKYFDNVEVEGIGVESNVSSQPFDEEIYIGVKNRVNNLKQYALENKIDADFFAASEAGITSLLGEYISLNAVYIESKKGFTSFATSEGFPIPTKYLKEIKNTELGKVLDRLFDGNKLSDGKGGISILTKGEISRIDLTESAYVMALTKFINNDLWK